MLKLTFKDSVTSQQRAWWNEAMSRSLWPYDAATVDLEATVETVDDPPCPGHAEYMCTIVWSYSDGTRPTAEFYMRTGADDPTQSFNAGVADDVKSFFMESVIHEYGHAMTYAFMTQDDVSKAKIAAWFQYKKTGRTGTLADWHKEGAPWEDQLAEGLAETFKDIWMPANYRYFSNRTNWWITRATYHEFIDYLYAFLCPNQVISV